MSPTQPTNLSAQIASFPKETIKAAIVDGKAMLKDARTKVEVAIVMYQKLKGADREAVIAAFKEGISTGEYLPH